MNLPDRREPVAPPAPPRVRVSWPVRLLALGGGLALLPVVALAGLAMFLAVAALIVVAIVLALLLGRGFFRIRIGRWPPPRA